MHMSNRFTVGPSNVGERVQARKMIVAGVIGIVAGFVVGAIGDALSDLPFLGGLLSLAGAIFAGLLIILGLLQIVGGIVFLWIYKE